MATGFKSGGRKKGTSNRLSGTVREMISKSLTSEFEILPELLDQLKPKDRIDCLIKLLPFIIPKADEEDISNKNRMIGHQEFVMQITRQLNERKQNQNIPK